MGERASTAIVSRLRERCCDLGTDDHGHTDCWLYGLAIEEIENLEHALTDTLGLLHLADDGRGHAAHYGGKRCGACGERWPCSQQIIRDHLAAHSGSPEPSDTTAG